MDWKNLLTTLFLVSSLCSISNGQQVREVILGGYNQVPAVVTHGTGTVEVNLQSDTLIVSGHFRDLVGTYSTAGIHYGGEKESGNRLFRLVPELDEELKSGEFSADENRFFLPASVKEALREGKLYINIVTRRHQRGEIRGQIPPMM
ncbi:MAG: CHRD domain-containing protein [Balneolaceae bacterium]